MKERSALFARTLVLAGGGHSHALLVRMIGMKPLPGTRVILVSDVTHTPYSGMLPGHIAGLYTFDEAHIDLRRLCTFAGTEFVGARATGIDLEKKLLQIENRTPLPFDYLSVNVGSVPEAGTISGARNFGVPVKPVPAFLRCWKKTLEQIANGVEANPIIIGGGAGGVELALNMRAALGTQAKISLVHAEQAILSTHNEKAQRLLREELKLSRIEVHCKQSVVNIDDESVTLEDGSQIRGYPIFLTTHASPVPFLKNSGLAVDDRGFMLTNDYLQSTSHPFVFAAGDTATIQDFTRPKSGVFAVRAAKPLLFNIRATISNRPLKKHSPQREFLSLIGTGRKSAIASRGSFGMKNRSLWWLKDWIDRRFMRKFANLPAMEPDDRSSRTGPNESLKNLIQKSQMRCLGCAAKVGAPLLNEVLEKLRSSYPALVRDDSPDALLDDAAILIPPPGQILVQTTDYVPALLDDLYTFGRVAVAHCLSDIFAMGATAHSVLATVLVPFSDERVMKSQLSELLNGVGYALTESEVALSGGHTAESNLPALGLTCNGIANDASLLRKSGAKPGEQLILTKAIGTGTLFAALMRLKAKGRWIDGAVSEMLYLNQEAGRLFLKYGATSCTDVTGFGLAGHLGEMIQASGCRVALNLEAVPVLEGALELTSQGVVSSLFEQNSQVAHLFEAATDHADQSRYRLLFDPQTSGGLLASLPREKASACLQALREVGAASATIIGEFLEGTPAILLR